jgi:hypothetical protein
MFNWSGDEFGGSDRLSDRQQNQAWSKAEANFRQIERLTAGRSGLNGESVTQMLERVVQDSFKRAPGGIGSDAFRYGISAALLEQANKQGPDRFVAELSQMRERQNPWAFWDQTPLDPVFERAKEYTRAYVEEATGTQSEVKPFGIFKGQNGPHAFSGGALDALIDEVAATATDAVRIAANPIEASRQAAEIMRNVHKLPEVVQKTYKEAEKLIQASQMDDYHKGFLVMKTVLVLRDLKDIAEGVGKVKHLADELAAGNIKTPKDALDALRNGPRRRDSGDVDGPDALEGNRPRFTPTDRSQTPTHPGFSRPFTPAEQVGYNALSSISEPQRPYYMQVLSDIFREKGVDTPDEARRYINNLNGAPDGPSMRELHNRAAALIRAADPPSVAEVMQTAVSGVESGKRNAYGQALNDVFREKGINTPDAAERYIRNLHGAPDGPSAREVHNRAHAILRREIDQVAGDAVVNMPSDKRPAYQQAMNSIFREKGIDTPNEARTYIKNLNGAPDGPSMREVHHRAHGILREQVRDYAGTATANMPEGKRDAYAQALNGIFDRKGLDTPQAAERYVKNLNGAPDGPSMKELHHRASMILREQLDDYAQRAVAKMPEDKRGAYVQALNQIFEKKGIDTPDAAERYVKNLNAAPDGPSAREVHNIAQRIFENTPLGRQTLPIPDQTDALLRYRGIDGPLAPFVKQEITDWANGKPRNAVENLRNSNGLLFGDGGQTNPGGLLGTALADAVATPSNRRAVESVIGDVRREAGQQGLTASELLDRFEQISMPGSAARADFDQRVGRRQTELGDNPQRPDRPTTPDNPTTPDRPNRPDRPRPDDMPKPDVGGGDQTPPRPPKPPTTGGRPDQPDQPGQPDRPGEGTPMPRPPNVDIARPRALMHDGKPWDIVGVNDGIPPSLTLLTENTVPRFVPRDALLPRTPDGQLQPREVSLVQLDGERKAVSSETYQVVGVEKGGLKIARDGGNGERIERVIPFNDQNQEVRFDFPGGGSYAARQTVMGSVRFDPIDPKTTTVDIVPGMRFEARLQGRELEGPRLIEMNPQGELFARNPANALQTPERISVSDIAPTWQKVTSSTAPDVDLYMDSAKHRQAGLRNGRDGEPLQQINTLNGNDRISHGFANQIYKPVLEALRDPATTGDVSIAMYGFGTSLDGKRYTDALLNYAQKNPDNKITIHSGDVEINGRRDGELKAWLAERYPNITITEPPAPSNFRVPHEKIVAIGDQVFISSEKIGMTMSRKIGFMAEVGGEDARVMHDYIKQLGDPTASSSDRARMVDQLAQRGILFDDPIAGRFPNAAAMYRTVAEAQEKLVIFQSDITDLEAAKLIARRSDESVTAGNPLQIDLKYRNIDPESERILNEAAARNPNLKHQLVAANGPLSPIYQHENFVLSEKGGVLSSAYMWEPKAGQVPRYTAGGEGGVMLNADQARQYMDFVDRQPTRQIGPGAIINEIEEALKKPDLWPKLMEFIERKLPWNRDRAADPDATLNVAHVSDTRAVASPVPVTAMTEQPISIAALGPTSLPELSTLPRPPQPGEPNYIAYAQSGEAVTRLNARFDLDPSSPQLLETSEKLRVAAATLAVNEGLRVDAIDLNKPAPNLPAGSLAFVIEQNTFGETGRYGTMKMQEVLQTPLSEGYQRLAMATPSPDLQAAQHGREQESNRQSIRSQSVA